MALYVLNDIVKHNEDTFICIQEHNSNNESEPGVGINWQTYWGRIVDKTKIIPISIGLSDFIVANNSLEWECISQDQLNLLMSPDILHNDLIDKSGGQPGEYYHLTRSQTLLIGSWIGAQSDPQPDKLVKNGSPIFNSVTVSSLRLLEKRPANARPAMANIVVQGTPLENDTITLNSQIFTFVVSRTNIYEITISADLPTQANNIVLALNTDQIDVIATINDTHDYEIDLKASIGGEDGNNYTITGSATGITINSLGGHFVYGLNGTVAFANETVAMGNVIYHSIDANTITGTNWRRIIFNDYVGGGQ